MGSSLLPTCDTSALDFPDIGTGIEIDMSEEDDSEDAQFHRFSAAIGDGNGVKGDNGSSRDNGGSGEDGGNRDEFVSVCFPECVFASFDAAESITVSAI